MGETLSSFQGQTNLYFPALTVGVDCLLNHICRKKFLTSHCTKHNLGIVTHNSIPLYCATVTEHINLKTTKIQKITKSKPNSKFRP